RDHEKLPEARQRRDDLLDNAIGEILLLWVAAHILKGKHSNGWLVGEREGRSPACGSSIARPHPIHTDRPRDVLELLLPCVLEEDVEFSLDVFQPSARHANATGLSKTFQTCRHVNAVPEDVATVDDYVANIDADAKFNPLFVRHIRVTLGHIALDIERATHRVNNAGELGQQAVASVLDNPPAVLSDLGINEGAQVILELGVRSLFVLPGQTAVASHICGQDGGQFTLDPVLPLS